MIADVKIEFVLTGLLRCLSSYNGNDHPHDIRECLCDTIQGESSHEFRGEVRENVAVVTRDHPQKFNALTVDMRNALATTSTAPLSNTEEPRIGVIFIVKRKTCARMVKHA